MLVAALACSPGADPALNANEQAAPPVASPALPTGAAVEIVWEDPEPPEAQALAEQVLHEAWNQDKITQLTLTTCGLQMSITTLISATSGINGFSSKMAQEVVSVDDRLANLGAEQTATEITIRLSGAILFDFDSAAIRPDAERALSEVAEVLKAYAERPVKIVGHTDAIASEEYNQRLSEKRAAAVSEWLAEHGVDQARLSSLGRGETQPIADNSTAEGRQQNRRVAIVITKT